jgi:hypothetical protein
MKVSKEFYSRASGATDIAQSGWRVAPVHIQLAKRQRGKR